MCIILDRFRLRNLFGRNFTGIKWWAKIKEWIKWQKRKICVLLLVLI